jgi:hypothetical protein
MPGPNPIETVKGTPGSADPTTDEQKVLDHEEADSRKKGTGSAAGRKPGEADAPHVPEPAKPSFT